MQQYKDNGNGTVTDNVTGLMWQQGETKQMTWENAISYAENLSLVGYSDWRLPTIEELISLVDYSKDHPAIDKTYFPDIHASPYWSSTTLAYNTNYAWNVYFGNGIVSNGSKSYSHYVRCVRDVKEIKK